MPNDLESRRRAITRALRRATRSDDRPAPASDTDVDVTALEQRVTDLVERVDDLARIVEALQTTQPALIPVTSFVEDEPPAGRVSVPPVTPAKISTQAFDVLFGTVPSREADEVGAEPRIA